MASFPIFIAGRFEVHRLLHARGMGDVYAGIDSENGRRVAVKVYAPRWTRRSQDTERFVNEVRAARHIVHFALAPTLEMGRLAGGRFYVASPFLAGRDLNEVLNGGPLSPAEASTLVSPIASALDALHDAGLVHRTVTAAKVRLTRDRGHPIVLTGFGAAPLLASPSDRRSVLVTSPTAIDYVAPEADQSTAMDGRADVYALGVLAFRMMTGTLPFPTRESVERALLDRQCDEPPKLSDVTDASFSDDLERIIACALACDPKLRYASAGSFARALSQALEVDHEIERAPLSIETLIPADSDAENDEPRREAPRVRRRQNELPTSSAAELVLPIGYDQATLWGAVLGLFALLATAFIALGSLFS